MSEMTKAEVIEEAKIILASSDSGNWADAANDDKPSRFESEAHELVDSVFIAGIKNGLPLWPQGFEERLSLHCCLAESDHDDSGNAYRWQFADGSAVVRIGDNWNFGIHKDYLADAENLIAEDENAQFVWPESHSAINRDWQVAK